ncbi:hypothetical protein [Parvularcula sp. IMCC14364]|uniref:hypothetical protein n=1 Tax=Parvularcula sp. IMCC14364 TaxID=3067902 RepID=UPI002742704F|nr:hypothetical protein [Parvularcula sp. IMCC14364]
MRIIKKTTVSAVVASGALLLAGLGLPGSGVAQAADGAIDWRITPATDALPEGHVKLHLRQITTRGGQMNSSDHFPLEDLEGLRAQDLNAAGSREVSFAMRRDAGELTCDGQAGEGAGIGLCDFAPSSAFSDALVARGLDAPKESEMFLLALQDARISLLDDMSAAGYDVPELDDFIALVIHGVDGDYVRELASVGVRPDDLVGFRIHGVTADFARAVRDMGPGFADLDSDDLMAMRIHGVTPIVANEYAALGFDGLEPKELIAFRIHGVTPAFIAAVRDMGYEDITADELIAFRIHGISASYLEAFTSRGYALPAPDEVVSMKIAGFDPRRMKKSAE